MSVVFSKRIKVETAASHYGQGFITTACPKCDHKWRLTNQQLDSGGSLQCPACKHIFTPDADKLKTLAPAPEKQAPAPAEEAKKEASAMMSLLQRDLMTLKIAAHEHAQRLVPVSANLDASAARIAFDMGAAAASEGAEAPREARAVSKNIVTLGQKVLISNPAAASAAAEVLTPHRFEREAAFCQRQQEAEEKSAKLMAAPAPAPIDRMQDPIGFSDAWRKACGTYLPPKSAFAAAMDNAQQEAMESAKPKHVRFVFDATGLVKERKKLEAQSQPKFMGMLPGNLPA